MYTYFGQETGVVRMSYHTSSRWADPDVSVFSVESGFGFARFTTLGVHISSFRAVPNKNFWVDPTRLITSERL